MFKKGDIVQIKNKGVAYLPYINRKYVFEKMEKDISLVISLETFKAPARSFKPGDFINFETTDLYLYFDIEDVVKNLEKLERKYEKF